MSALQFATSSHRSILRITAIFPTSHTLSVALGADTSKLGDEIVEKDLEDFDHELPEEGLQKFSLEPDPIRQGPGQVEA